MQLSQALLLYSEMHLNLKPRHLGEVQLKATPDVNVPKGTQWAPQACWHQQLYWAWLKSSCGFNIFEYGGLITAHSSYAQLHEKLNCACTINHSKCSQNFPAIEHNYSRPQYPNWACSLTAAQLSFRHQLQQLRSVTWKTWYNSHSY